MNSQLPSYGRTSALTIGLFLAALLGIPLAFRAMGSRLVLANHVASISTGMTGQATTQAKLQENYGKLPLNFEANRGQAPAPVKFLARGQGYSFLLTPDEAVMQLHKDDAPQQSVTLRMRLAKAKRQPRLSGAAPLPGKSNYFLGNDPQQWQTDVPTFGKVKYESVYPGIDLVYYGNQQQLEYDFIVAPGSAPDQIRMQFAGAEQVCIAENGDLILQTAAGEVRQHKPFTYQAVNGAKQPVASRYVLHGQNEIGFEVAAYNASQPLVIDPVLSYGTFLGATSSSGAGHGEAIAVDAAGNAYITGYVGGGFPTTPGALRLTNTAPSATFAFIVKLDPTGSTALYSALIGGTAGFYVPNTEPEKPPSLYLENRAYDIAIDAQGNAYVAGETRTSNFPTTPGAFQRTIAPGMDDRHPPGDAFVVKLNAAGNALSYATLLGAVGRDVGYAVAVNANGEAWVVGTPAPNGFPTTLSAFMSNQTGGAAFVTKLNAAGSALLYSTYFGGPPSGLLTSGSCIATSVALDAQGNAYVVGTAGSIEFPYTPGVYRAPGNVFIAKFSASGIVAYATTLGAPVTGSFPDARWDTSVAVDAGGNAYVAGSCEWDKFPTTPGAFQPTGGSPNPDFANIDGFVAKLNPNATALLYATYLGGIDDHDLITDIAVDREGCAYLTGYTFARRFPVTAGSYRPASTGSGAFVTKLNAAGTGLVYSTVLGNNDSRARGIAVDAVGNAYLTGGARHGFVTTPGSYQPLWEGLATLPPSSGKSYDHAFASKLAATISAEPLAPSPLPAPTPIPRPSTYGVGIKALDGSGYGIPNVTINWTGTSSGNRVTDSRGGTVIEALPADGDYLITATLAGRSFNPPSYSLTKLSEGATLFFTLVALPTEKFQITGYLTDENNHGLGNARVSLSGARSGTATTDAQGFYAFRDLAGGSNYTVAPVKQGSVDFVPRNQTFNSLGGNQRADFKRPPQPQPLVNVSAASYDSNRFATDSIVTAFGAKLALETFIAASDPLPVYLVGTTVIIRDSRSEEHFAPLFFVSPTQVNYLIPAGVASGLATVIITGGDGRNSAAGIQIEDTAPGLFTADASGRGLAAGVALRVKANGAQSYEALARYDTGQNKLVPVPIDLGAAGDQVYLICFGTGFRYRSGISAVGAQLSGVAAQVSFAGAQGSFAGLDQANLLLPRTLAGRGEVNLTLSVDGKAANPVKVWVK